MHTPLTFWRHLRIAATLLLIGAALAPGYSARAADATSPPNLADVLRGLTVSSFMQKKAASDALANVDDPRTLVLLKALLSGHLYYRKSDKQVLVLSPSGDAYAVRDAVSGKLLGSSDKDGLTKITINNQMRGSLREAIARRSLYSKDRRVRLAAVDEMLDNLTPHAVGLLRTMRESEKDPAVLAKIRTGLALADLNHGSDAQRLAAIHVLAGGMNQTARNRLRGLLRKNPDGGFVEGNATVRAAARTALASIERRIEFYTIVQTGFFGLSLGSVLLLSAIGLAITFGVMGVINMAHGEMMMLGAYTTYVVQLMMPSHIDVSLFVAIPAAFAVSGLAGIIIERGVIRFLYGRPLETLLATFGISLFLQQLVRTVFSPLNRAVESPSWMSGSLQINSALSLTNNRLYVLIFALLVFAALQLVMKKTALGLQVRAVSQNREMARAMGVRTGWVDAMTFGLGSGIAGIAGVALSQLTNVGPNLGQSYIVDSFMVVVFGGVGNLWGTLVGAMSLGVFNKVLEPWSGAVLAKILMLVLIILFIQKRPRGLFPQKGRGAEG